MPKAEDDAGPRRARTRVVESPPSRTQMHAAITRLALAATTALTLSAPAGRGGGAKVPAATRTSRATTTAAAAETAPATATTATDPCSLLTDAEVTKLAPGVGHG